MTCRLATLEDVELLAHLNHELIQDEGQPSELTPTELADRMRNWLQGEYRAVIFEEADEVLAYALYCIGQRSASDRFIFLRHFFVQRGFRRKGKGREAFRMLRTEVLPAGARILLDVLYHNQAARDFWERLGFKEHCITLELRPGRDFKHPLDGKASPLDDLRA